MKLLLHNLNTFQWSPPQVLLLFNKTVRTFVQVYCCKFTLISIIPCLI